MALLPVVVGALAGMCICTGLHHLIYGLYRPHNRAALLFSLLCLLITAYTLAGPLATVLAGDAITAMARTWPITCLFLAASASAWFLAAYAGIRQIRLPLVVSSVSLLAAAINLVLPALPLIALAILPAVGLVGWWGYAIYRLYQAGVYRSAAVLAGSLLLGLALFVSDLLVDQWVYDLPYLFAYAFPLLVLIISGDLVARSAQTANLTAETASNNARLCRDQEELVTRRTRQIRRRAEELASLNSIARQAASVADVPVLLQQVSETLRTTLQAHSVLVSLLDNHRKMLKVVVATPAGAAGSAAITEATFALVDYPVAQQTLEQGDPIVIDDAQTSTLLKTARDTLEQYGIQSVLLIPLRVQGDTIGLLTVSADRPGMAFGRDEVSLAETSAGYIAAIIDKACLQSYVHETASITPHPASLQR